MAAENVSAFVQKCKQDPTLRQRVSTLDDAMRVAAEIGLPFTAEEYEQAASDLSEDDLKDITGGIMR